jgi:hypothetical protein
MDSGKLGDGEKAKQLLEKALDVTKLIKSEYSQTGALSAIAQTAGKLGDGEKGKQLLEKALDVTKLIKSESSQTGALSAIAQTAGKFYPLGRSL